MVMEEQMIISGVARIWCEGTKRGVDCEDRDHCRTYGRPIRPWPAPKLKTPSSDPCWGFVPGRTGDLCTQNSMRLPPIILGLRVAFYQNAEGVASRGRFIALDPSRPADLKISFSSGVGAPGPKRFYCFLKLIECLSWR